MKAYRFRLYPTSENIKKMERTLDLCRFTYNELLGEFSKWDNISKYELQQMIVDLQICNPQLKEVYSKVLQYENYRLFSNLKALGETKKQGRKVGRLRFKGKGVFKTFSYNQSGFKLLETNKRYDILKLSKIGEIAILCHRDIIGEIKQVVIKRESSNKWFATLITDVKKEIVQKKIKSVVGIDTGLIDVLWDSKNKITPNPKYYKKYEKELAKCQRDMSRKKKGSNNRNKERIILARKYEKLTNVRDDFINKITRYYADTYDAVGMEDLDYSKMAKGIYGKSFLDACCGRIREQMKRKVESTGGLFVAVDYRGTTIRCHKCGTEVRKDIWERIHNCPKCKINIPRDYNSALEIEKLAIIKIGLERPELSPEEMTALHSNVQQPSMSQEATSSTATAVRVW
jgi:putative transposase